MRSTTEAQCYVHFDDNSWSQVKLPVRYGGFGLRTATDLALPAFLSSRAASSLFYINDILHQPTNSQDDKDKVRALLERYPNLPPDPHKQRNWNDIQRFSAVANMVPLLNQHRLASFKTASRPESGAYLNCIPNSRVGIFIDNDTLRIGVPLASHSQSVFLIDANARRMWTCSMRSLCHAATAQWGIPSHSAVDDVVRRGHSVAGIQSMLEPSSLDRGDGKRPDEITAYPCSRGRSLIWDATLVNTYAFSNIIRSALATWSVADAD